MKVPILLSALLAGSAYADHEAATPRNVVERQLGPLRVGAQLPTSFAGCGSNVEGEPQEEYLAFFDDPNQPMQSAMLSINVNCLGGDRRPVPCTPKTPRFVTFLSLQTRGHQPDKIQPRCQLPLSPTELATSRGIVLGDPIQKVRQRYGPASTNDRLAQRLSPAKFHIVYTKAKDTGDDRELLFRFENRAVVQIMITMGGEGEPDWSKEFPGGSTAKGH
jgi:hypothetical protein